MSCDDLLWESTVNLLFFFCLSFLTFISNHCLGCQTTLCFLDHHLVNVTFKVGCCMSHISEPSVWIFLCKTYLCVSSCSKDTMYTGDFFFLPAFLRRSFCCYCSCQWSLVWLETELLGCRALIPRPTPCIASSFVFGHLVLVKKVGNRV